MIINYSMLFFREWLTPNALQQSITTIQEREDSDNSPLWDVTWPKICHLATHKRS